MSAIDTIQLMGKMFQNKFKNMRLFLGSASLTVRFYDYKYLNFVRFKEKIVTNLK